MVDFVYRDSFLSQILFFLIQFFIALIDTISFSNNKAN
jgi:hypothetical protein